MRQNVQHVCDLNLHDSSLIEVRICGDRVFMVMDYIMTYEGVWSKPMLLAFFNVHRVAFDGDPVYSRSNSILSGDETRVGEVRRGRFDLNSGGCVEVDFESLEITDDFAELPKLPS